MGLKTLVDLHRDAHQVRSGSTVDTGALVTRFQVGAGVWRPDAAHGTYNADRAAQIRQQLLNGLIDADASEFLTAALHSSLDGTCRRIPRSSRTVTAAGQGQDSDGIVPLMSQQVPLGGAPVSGVVHSVGTEKLGFNGPSELDYPPIQALVIQLLNASLGSSSFHMF
jgi:hypothetical protein